MPDDVLHLGPLLGLNVRYLSQPHTREHPSLCASMYNVFLREHMIGIRRPNLVTVSLTSGPSGIVWQLFRHQPAASESLAELWAWSGTSTLHRRVSGTWSSVTASDTVTTWEDARPYAATYNGNLYLAYDSDVNRLHVWDGTSCRRVGIEASAAATVANTGAGAYAATLRYYKIQWKIISGSDTIATSELSAAVSFTPSGGGTAARVTKPTTPDSATHWIVFASTDGVTYYNLSGDVVVATTTYDDSAAVTAYSAGTVAPTAGLYVPPPSAKYLLATDNRLFMAGCWETTASATQTGVKNSRVWFTQVNGALDETGEAEAIAQTTTTKDWIDLGENDGDTIVGLAGPLDGIIYVFKRRSIWRLIATGLSDVPYRAERISSTLGATSQSAVCMAEDERGSACLYFVSNKVGITRLSPSGGLVNVSDDLFLQTSSAVSDSAILLWEGERRVLWAIAADVSNSYTSYAYQPEFAFMEAGKLHGGWTAHTIAGGVTGAGGGYAATKAACLYDVASVGLTLHLGGYHSTSTGVIGYLARTGTGTDFSLKTPSTYVVSALLAPTGGLSRFRVEAPWLEWPNPNQAVAWTVGYFYLISSPDLPGASPAAQASVSATSSNLTYAGGVNLAIMERLEGLRLSDLLGMRVQVAWTTGDGAIDLCASHLAIPWRRQEPA